MKIDYEKLSNDLNKIKDSKEWIDKYKPVTLDDIILPTRFKHLVNEWTTLTDSEDGKSKVLNMPNLMLCGSQGMGKTTLANVITNTLNIEPLFINSSVSNSIDVVRNQIAEYASYRSIINSFTNKIDKKIVIMDEFDNFTVDAQKALRGFIEQYKDKVRFITTLNFPDKVLDPIKSRFKSGTIDIDKVFYDHKQEVAQQLINRLIKILNKEGVEYDPKVLFSIVENEFPDIRSIISVAHMEFIKHGNLKNPISNVNRNQLIDVIKGGDMVKMHKFAKDHTTANRIFKELREYFVENDNYDAIILIAQKAETITFSVDKTITILALMAELRDYIK